MQANCPQCSQKIVIDDARVPDRAFSVKCPKCQTTVKFPGRGGPPVAEAPTEPAGYDTPPPSPPLAGDQKALSAQLRRELSAPAADPGSAGRALVCLPERALAGTVATMLTRVGYIVDTVEDADEAARGVEQGVYNLAVTARVTGAPGKETLFQRIGRLSPDNRRRIFLTLVGEEWKSGDGFQGFAATADLVLNSHEAASADTLVRSTVHERTRVYQVYFDARARLERAADTSFL